MGIIKDRNNMDLTEAEEIKKRQQEHTEELYKKGLDDPDNQMVWSVTQSQTSCNVKSSGPQEALPQTNLVEVMEFQLSYVKILKDDAVKVLHSICQQIWKIQQCPQDWKRSIFIPIPKKDNAKECSNYCTLISHTSKLMLKIIQASIQQYMN